MIGFYNYTMLLTYMSLLSSSLGIIFSLNGTGHPFIGTFFLLFCGLCDAFDGKVARMKKDRSQTECSFGIQIDSLSDLVAFGVLPACIGVAIFKTSPFFVGIQSQATKNIVFAGLLVIMVLYALAAMIRLAYFNVTEEERQKTEGGVRKYYTGLPVTSASLIFPTVMLIKYLLPIDISVAYFAVMAFTGYAFLSKLQIKKPGLRAILFFVAIGVVELALMIILRQCGSR